ncbi:MULTISPECIES: DUF1192 domain-containing protein [unclassified Martelella]|uniref:DUF1192 domain-containing protein n=1 Tax=unclassified Martelella TaxID=2629616 RepID=UPI0025B7A921|nr:DUF1192 domain-containing protein [Martelella sp.]|tara:strand:- start:442 stop:726 length:285 start_codon:yes stop_codon:yes gene_type:complete
MWNEDESAPKKSDYVIGSDLEQHSVEALKGFADALRAEIERIEAAIARKGSGGKFLQEIAPSRRVNAILTFPGFYWGHPQCGIGTSVLIPIITL